MLPFVHTRHNIVYNECNSREGTIHRSDTRMVSAQKKNIWEKYFELVIHILRTVEAVGGSVVPAQASQAWRRETVQRRTMCPGHQGLT